jgi:26S proteasome regulatory subunit N1
MAKEGQRSAAADKGKGKAEDVRELNGQKRDAKDDKTKAGKKEDKDDELQEGTVTNQPILLVHFISQPSVTSTWTHHANHHRTYRGAK